MNSIHKILTWGMIFGSIVCGPAVMTAQAQGQIGWDIPQNQPGWDAPQQRCDQFYPGANIFVYHARERKTAVINRVYGDCFADVSFYGYWSGNYRIDLYDAELQIQNPTRPGPRPRPYPPAPPRPPRGEPSRDYQRCYDYRIGDIIVVHQAGRIERARITYISGVNGCSAQIEYLDYSRVTSTVDLSDRRVRLDRGRY